MVRGTTPLDLVVCFGLRRGTSGDDGASGAAGVGEALSRGSSQTVSLVFELK